MEQYLKQWNNILNNILNNGTLGGCLKCHQIPEWLIITTVWETGKKYKLQNFM